MEKAFTGGQPGMTPAMGAGHGSFEMQRMLRQNAHEKAFEIKVMAQRLFESEKS